MKIESTMFLRAVVLLLAVAVLAILCLLLPQGIASDQTGEYRPILLGLYVPAVPFFWALYQAWVLLRLIERNTAFSNASTRALRRIKRCAAAIAALFTAGLPYIHQVAQNDDAPGVLALGFVIVFASVVIMTFAALLQKLLQNAIDIKSENELTV